MSGTLRRFLLFGIAGAAGFVVDTAVLYALVDLLNPYGARLVSFVAAVFTTWLINRNFAFAQQAAGVPLWREFVNYFLAMLTGGVVNYGVYAAMVATIPVVAAEPVIGLAAGTLCGMVANFLLADRVVFNGRG